MKTKKLISHLSDPKLKSVMKIQSLVLEEVSKFFREKGFIEIPPVMISPITDPLAHDVHQSNIDYEGQKLQLTKSMIFHKQLALAFTGLDKIYIMSPNVRLEKSCEAKQRHLLEFHQIDFEIKDGSKEDVYLLMEEFLSRIVKKCKTELKDDLKTLGRKLYDLESPFERIKTYDARKEYGKDFEKILSKEMSQPFWLESFYREFYDKEHKERGKFENYDLIYPEGFEEGLSGAEREHEHKEIIRKMEERGMDKEPYEIYLKLSEQGLLPKTAGAGFGLQRLLRYLTGIREIEKVVLFPRSPREEIIF